MQTIHDKFATISATLSVFSKVKSMIKRLCSVWKDRAAVFRNNVDVVNVLSKSRVWENYKYGFVGTFIVSELKINFMENL